MYSNENFFIISLLEKFRFFSTNRWKLVEAIEYSSVIGRFSFISRSLELMLTMKEIEIEQMINQEGFQIRIILIFRMLKFAQMT